MGSRVTHAGYLFPAMDCPTIHTDHRGGPSNPSIISLRRKPSTLMPSWKMGPGTKIPRNDLGSSRRSSGYFSRDGRNQGTTRIAARRLSVYVMAWIFKGPISLPLESQETAFRGFRSTSESMVWGKLSDKYFCPHPIRITSLNLY